MSPYRLPPVSAHHLIEMWKELNGHYFAGLLPPIDLVWSRRLTSSVGMFVSRRGPRPRLDRDGIRPPTKREIRLSLPLLQQVVRRSEYGKQEIASTLAHEMIHQWQYDILKRRPNHGVDFLRKMTEMNRDGALAITIYHSLQKEVLALTRFAWRCRQCGRVYRRQRRTIQPRRHHCGICRGLLQELVGSVSRVLTKSERDSYKTASHSQRPLQSVQLSFTF
ncbi:MAG TPA: SprT-like domain-containing protein [Nitrospiraceae bacterium]|nr:SprT-like domain-containing protein [Nitrospiraceae bacterium]